eukprot:CAMPEP_0201492706 /NCGR_PEP_ID=MMETSP0151_2-20130828/34424_1 /ASSEMBLY_ACC=CAM_ASM_000257 /TAXON_ID=200890 /ORGANISM="Paramoeba atlantica, Strain 621/1 / CCAP 1560/9" /LENGTH=210 /DNA_ID=CAMNT_0047879687 /DNA_START=51 /DNA_END=683 /DNA_ORIENTATION=-
MTELYHEKQSLQRCALHTLNNLFQKEEFTKADLDNICYFLSPGAFINPHKSIWGTGNYDVNVIMYALTSREKTCKWWDRRKDVSEMPIEGDNIFGIIVNRTSSKFAGFWKSKHWFAIVKVRDTYFDFNSNLRTPVKFETREEILDFFRKEIKNGGEVIRVLNKEEEGEEAAADEQGDGKKDNEEGDKMVIEEGKEEGEGKEEKKHGEEES